MQKYITNNSGFSIIEVLIGIFVFSLGLISIYALLASSLSINTYNKNAIIASNLAREQVELFRNIRDTNYTKLQVWKQKNPGISYNSGELFEVEKYYRLENNFDITANFSVDVSEISPFHEGKDRLGDMQNYKLCLNSANTYTYDCSGGNRQTVFYKYLLVEQTDGELGDVYTITSKVIWYQRGYHEYDIKTIVSDWRRI